LASSLLFSAISRASLEPGFFSQELRVSDMYFARAAEAGAAEDINIWKH